MSYAEEFIEVYMSREAFEYAYKNITILENNQYNGGMEYRVREVFDFFIMVNKYNMTNIENINCYETHPTVKYDNNRCFSSSPAGVVGLLEQGIDASATYIKTGLSRQYPKKLSEGELLQIADELAKNMPMLEGEAVPNN